MADDDELGGAIGPRKAAMLLRAIGEDRSHRLFSRMNDAEISKLAKATARLGTIDAESLENLVSEFNDKITDKAAPDRPAKPAVRTGDADEEAPKRAGLMDFEA